MMLYEWGLVEDISDQKIKGIVTFAAFAMFGVVPLVPYIVAITAFNDRQAQYPLLCLFIASILYIMLGFGKGSLLKLSKIRCMMETLLCGGMAMAAGYLIGVLL